MFKKSLFLVLFPYYHNAILFHALPEKKYKLDADTANCPSAPVGNWFNWPSDKTEPTLTEPVVEILPDTVTFPNIDVLPVILCPTEPLRVVPATLNDAIRDESFKFTTDIKFW